MDGWISDTAMDPAGVSCLAKSVFPPYRIVDSFCCASVKCSHQWAIIIVLINSQTMVRWTSSCLTHTIDHCFALCYVIHVDTWHFLEKPTGFNPRYCFRFLFNQPIIFPRDYIYVKPGRSPKASKGVSENLWDRWIWILYRPRFPACHAANSVKTLKGVSTAVDGQFHLVSVTF